jgi:hypothetical protein
LPDNDEDTGTRTAFISFTSAVAESWSELEMVCIICIKVSLHGYKMNYVDVDEWHVRSRCRIA